MENWLDQLAASLEQEPLSPEEITRLLDTARDVAHLVERRMTPLASFMMGMDVGTRMSSGVSRDEALTQALNAVRERLPQRPSEPQSLEGSPE